MTLEELETLRQRASDVLGIDIAITRRKSGWCFYTGSEIQSDCMLTVAELINVLKSHATPPRPDTVQITVPFAWAMWRTRGGIYDTVTIGHREAVDAACREAVEPWLGET